MWCRMWKVEVLCTLVLQVKWRQCGLHHSWGQSAAVAGLAEVMLDPFKEPGMSVTGPRRLVKVNDTSTRDKKIHIWRQCEALGALLCRSFYIFRITGAIYSLSSLYHTALPTCVYNQMLLESGLTQAETTTTLFTLKRGRTKCFKDNCIKYRFGWIGTVQKNADQITT